MIFLQGSSKKTFGRGEEDSSRISVFKQPRGRRNVSKAERNWARNTNCRIWCQKEVKIIAINDWTDLHAENFPTSFKLSAVQRLAEERALRIPCCMPVFNHLLECRKDELSELSKELEKQPKVASRKSYIDRVKEITKNSRKQDTDLERILKDTRELQLESNSIQERLHRTYAVVDEMVFR